MSGGAVPPFIHIGYHRAGSTFLQRNVFQPHPGLRSLSRKSIHSYLLEPGGMDFDAGVCRGWLEGELGQAHEDGQRLLLSDEELSGNIHTGGGGGYVTKEVATRLHAVASEATIFIVVRNQVDMIESVYRQYVKRGGTLSLRGYLVDRGDNHRLPGFRFRHLDYHRLIQLYSGLFGEDRVKVLPYELLQRNPRAFLSELGGYLDLPSLEAESARRVNRGFSPASLMLARVSNRLYGGDRVNRRVLAHVPGSYELFRCVYAAIDRVPASRKVPVWGARLRERDRLQVEERYRKGNRWVEEFTGRPLGHLGYAT